jgi:drug/metabolite transporter (DMT)-like permease
VLLAALLFGATAPLCKVLLGDAAPLALAALLYLGSGVGLSAWLFVRRMAGGAGSKAATLEGKDWLTLSGAVAAGGVLAPVLFLVGLSHSAASTASLLLNLEMVFTALLAWMLFREGFEGRVAWGLALILAGCLLLAWPADGMAGWGTGALPIAGACLCWGMDNNLTQRLADRDPVQIAAIKGLAGGSVNAALAFALGQSLPAGIPLLAALCVGLFGYGVSLVLFVVSLGRIGTARTIGVFAAAPFAGTCLSLLILDEAPTLSLFLAAMVLVAGLIIAIGGRHAHGHTHEATTHSHRHGHDEHHGHDHGEDGFAERLHDHLHTHEPLHHAHDHYPDTHHRHGH